MWNLQRETVSPSIPKSKIHLDSNVCAVDSLLLGEQRDRATGGGSREDVLCFDDGLLQMEMNRHNLYPAVCS